MNKPLLFFFNYFRIGPRAFKNKIVKFELHWPFRRKRVREFFLQVSEHFSLLLNWPNLLCLFNGSTVEFEKKNLGLTKD